MQRVRAARPELKDRALLLHARDPRRGELIVACCRLATTKGVRAGMSLAEATALTQRGGRFEIQRHDPAADVQAWAELAAACERFSPHVGWRTIGGGIAGEDPAREAAPEALYLELTGIGPLFDGEACLAREILAECRARRLTARVGIAETIGAAWCATFTETADRDSFDILPHGTAAAACADLPVERLRLPEETQRVLEQLGICTIAQLSALPRDGAACRLGDRPLVRWDQLCGGIAETIVPHHPPPQFAAWQALEYPRRDTATIEWILTQLVERIATALQARGEGALELQLRLDCAGAPLIVRVGLFRPSSSARHILDLLHLRLETLRLPGPVGRIGIQALTTAKLEQRQTELFPDDLRTGTRELAVLIDRLSGRLGAERVTRPELLADPLPERAYRTAPPGETTRRRAGHLAASFAPLERPLQLFDPPLRLSFGDMEDNLPPQAFEWRGVRHDLARQWGPERIETGWWRERLVRRDYWRVETDGGERFWLFRDLRGGEWFLAGAFA